MINNISCVAHSVFCVIFNASICFQMCNIRLCLVVEKFFYSQEATILRKIIISMGLSIEYHFYN